MAAKYFDLDMLYRFLTPRKNGDDNSTVKTEAEDIIRDQILNPREITYTISQINSNIQRYLSDSNNELTDDVKKNLFTKFRIIGPNLVGPSSKEQDTYWSSIADPVSNIQDVSKSSEASKIAFALVRDPAISPAQAGVDKIGRFLNYTPSIVVSQMVPYLDVKFAFKDANATTRTPGTIRFLLGSVNETSLSKNDRILDGNSVNIGEDENPVYTGLAGMEMFLLPQTLTNMDNLNDTKRGSDAIRLLPPKPFVPPASIEGFDVTVQNAGAGSFASKRANLKFKIHDKSRVSEFADFLKGSSGAAYMTVTTTFGWSAPEGRDDENEFFKFINTYMRQTDTWAVVNTQFAFDATGQVNIGVQLASNPTTNRDPALIVIEDDPRLRELEKRREYIRSVYSQISLNRTSAASLQKSASSNKDKKEDKDPIKIPMEVLFLASQGTYTKAESDKKNAISVTDSLIDDIFKNNIFLEEVRKVIGSNDIADLKQRLKDFLPKQKDGKKDNPKSSESILTAVSSDYQRNKFNTLFDTPDPFLPRNGTDFDDDLVALVTGHKKPTSSTAGKEKERQVPQPPATPPSKENQANAAAQTARAAAQGLVSGGGPAQSSSTSGPIGVLAPPP